MPMTSPSMTSAVLDDSNGSRVGEEAFACRLPAGRRLGGSRTAFAMPINVSPSSRLCNGGPSLLLWHVDKSRAFLFCKALVRREFEGLVTGHRAVGAPTIEIRSPPADSATA